MEPGEANSSPLRIDPPLEEFKRAGEAKCKSQKLVPYSKNDIKTWRYTHTLSIIQMLRGKYLVPVSLESKYLTFTYGKFRKSSA